jgi:hypothetical protein
VSCGVLARMSTAWCFNSGATVALVSGISKLRDPPSLFRVVGASGGQVHAAAARRREHSVRSHTTAAHREYMR